MAEQDTGRTIGLGLIGLGLLGGAAYVAYEVYTSRSALLTEGNELGIQPRVEHFVLVAEETSRLVSNAPAYGDVRTVLHDVVQRAAPSWAGTQWVGPGPRVTRTVSGVVGPNITRVAWVLEVPAAKVQALGGPDATRAVLTGELRRALATIPSSSWSSVGVEAYESGINGTLAWWRDAQNGAAVTTTRDQFPGLGAEIAGSAQNAIGPDDARLRPRDLFGSTSGESPIQQLADLFRTVAWVTVPHVVLGAMVIYVPRRALPWNWGGEPKRQLPPPRDERPAPVEEEDGRDTMVDLSAATA